MLPRLSKYFCWNSIFASPPRSSCERKKNVLLPQTSVFITISVLLTLHLYWLLIHLWDGQIYSFLVCEVSVYKQSSSAQRAPIFCPLINCHSLDFNSLDLFFYLARCYAASAVSVYSSLASALSHFARDWHRIHFNWQPANSLAASISFQWEFHRK